MRVSWAKGWRDRSRDGGRHAEAMGGAKPQFTKVVIAQLLEKFPTMTALASGSHRTSPLEGDGFGLSVPRDRDDGFRSSSRARLLREQD